jgi:hypothetical protein
MDQTLILPYHFCVYYKAIVHFYHVSGVVSEDLHFYSKQNFTAYLRQSTYKNIRDCHENQTTNNIFALAKVALYDDPCDLISDGEYVEDDQDDEFVCFVNNIETNASTYLEENNVTYNYDGSTSTQFANWK